MIAVGKFQKLEVVRFTDFGAYLGDDTSDEEILLPNRYIPETLQTGSTIEVFVYTDSEDRPIATTLQPYAVLGEIAILEVVDVARNGCYLDLGIAKDIFMPTKVPKNYKKGQKVAVKINLDKQNRLIARLGIKEGLTPAPKHFKEAMPVKGFVFEKSDLGYGCVIEGKHYGLLYANELFEEISIGEQRGFYIKKIRSDGKLDLSIKKIGSAALKDDAGKVLEKIIESGGALPLHYDSDPAEIEKCLGMSKKAFKRSLTRLIQSEKITLEAGVKIALK